MSLPQVESNKFKLQVLFIALSLVAMFFGIILINQTLILPTNIVVVKPNQEMLTDTHLTWISQNQKIPGGDWHIDLQFARPNILTVPELMHSGCLTKFLLNESALENFDSSCLNSEQIKSHFLSHLKEKNSATISGKVAKGSFGFLFLPSLESSFLQFFIFLCSVSLSILIYNVCRLLVHSPREAVYVSLLIPIGTLLRAWSIFIAHPLEAFLVSDMKMYALRAEQLLNSSFNTKLFFQPIGYSLYSAISQWLGDQQWYLLKFGHLLFSSLTIWVAWRTCLYIYDKTVARISLFLLSFSVPLWSLASFHLSETLYTFFIACLAYFTVKNFFKPNYVNAVGVGFSFALGFFVKGSLSFFFPAFLIWNFFIQPKHLRLKNSLLISFSALMIAIIHGISSYQMIDQFKLGADAGGLNFVEGKCPSKHNYGPDGESWLSPLFGFLKETQSKKWPRPFSDQGYYWAEGFKCIAENPAVLITSVRYIYYLFWGNPLWPSSYSIFNQAENLWEWFFAIFIAPFIFIALINIVQKPRDPQFVFALMTLALFFAVYLFKSELRFRVPFDVILIPMAIDCILRLWRRLKILLVSNTLE